MADTWGGSWGASWLLSWTQSAVAPAPVIVPTKGGSGGKKRKRQIFHPREIVWETKKRKTKPEQVEEVIHAIQQVAAAEPEFQTDYAGHAYHLATMLLADMTITRLREINSTYELARLIDEVIERDDEEVLLLM